MAEEDLDSEKRVCPDCGAPAGEAPFCATCGVNLSNQARLPTRGEWESSSEAAGAAAETTATAEPPAPSPPPPPPPAPRTTKPRPRWVKPVLIGGAVIVALGAVYWFVLTERYEVPSEAMEPTYEVGDHITVKKWDQSPEIGDVVVFHPPTGAIDGTSCAGPKPPGEVCTEPTPETADEVFVKRVVAEGGDTLTIEDGEAIANGEPVTGDWETRPCHGLGGCDFPREVTIPEDHYFVLGDNRGASDDSRYWGPISADSIIGVVQ